MNISFRWLDEMFPGGELEAMGSAELAARLTMQGLAVDAIRRPFAEMSGVVLGKVLEAGRHPNADRLTLCRVAAGDGERQVVCGAPNVQVGAIYPYATEGARLPGGREIRRTRIRGVESEGMLCSAPELGLDALGSADGIWPVPGVAERDVGRDLVEALDLDDEILEIDVPSNRGDALCHLGIAREAQWHAKALARLPARLLTAEGPSSDFAVEIEDPEGCPGYLGRLIRGVAVGPSPAWLQIRLLALGLRPVNNVVDATNYVMLECGQPLHPFDAERLEGRTIVVRRPRRGERIVTLDGRERALDPEMTLIADAERAVAIGGVMGGLDSEVGGVTESVFLEAAWFDPPRVGGAARRLGLRTDAATRFSRGVDPAITAVALDRAAALVVEVAGGEVAADRVGQAIARESGSFIQLRPERLNAVVGRSIPPEEARRALESLGFAVGSGDAGAIRALVPGWRFDVQREIDVVEEVARLTGYERIPPAPLPAPVVAPTLSAVERSIERVRSVLRASGYDEARTPSFVGEDALGPGSVDKLVEIRNPISKADRFLRPFIFTTLAAAVAHNLNRGAAAVRLFEIGHAFEPGASGGLEETRRAALAAAGRVRPVDWAHAVLPIDFFDVKGDVEELLRQAGTEEVGFVEDRRSYLHPGRQASIESRGEGIGFLGEVHPRLAEEWGVAERLYVAEIRLDALTRMLPRLRVERVPREPAVQRDLALVVPIAHSSERIVAAVRGAGVEDLERIEIFDRYEGAQVPDDHYSLGLRLTFQADRTLTVEGIDGRVGRLVELLEKEHGYRLR